MTDSSVLLVPGPTGALGEAVVTALAASGHRLMLAGRNEPRLDSLVEPYAGEGRVERVVADASQPLGARQAVNAALDTYGRIDGLVHLIGGFHVGPVALTDLDTYRRLYEVNLLSAVSATQAVLPQLGPDSHLVYVSSVLASEPFPGFGAYAAGKAALAAWVRSLAHEVKHRGVHANLVVMTMADTAEARANRPHVDFDHAVRPEAVARVIDFLVSPAADGMYGVAVPVLGRFELSSALTAPPPGAPAFTRL